VGTVVGNLERANEKEKMSPFVLKGVLSHVVLNDQTREKKISFSSFDGISYHYSCKISAFQPIPFQESKILV